MPHLESFRMTVTVAVAGPEQTEAVKKALEAFGQSFPCDDDTIRPVAAEIADSYVCAQFTGETGDTYDKASTELISQLDAHSTWARIKHVYPDSSDEVFTSWAGPEDNVRGQKIDIAMRKAFEALVNAGIEPRDIRPVLEAAQEQLKALPGRDMTVNARRPRRGQ